MRSLLKKVRIGHLYMILGAAVAVHIFLLMCSSERISSQNRLDAAIPFNLLMFGLIMASFIPMLVYSYMVNLLKGAQDARYEKRNLISDVTQFRNAIDFIVDESAMLITMAILVGSFAFIETNIQPHRRTPWFLLGYYLWYLVVAVVWSFIQFRMTEVGKKIQKEWTDWWKYILGIYLWIAVYITISVILLINYLTNYSCPNSVVWIKYLITVTSLWLLLSSILWIIPSDQYHPMWSLKESFFKGRKK